MIARKPRTCRDCGLCCTHMAVKELDKPVGVRCVHLRGTRCSRYETRPQICREFECAWLQGAPCPKPARDHVIAIEAIMPHGNGISVHYAGKPTAHAKRWIDLAARRVVVFLINGNKRTIKGPAPLVSMIVDAAAEYIKEAQVDVPGFNTHEDDRS